MTDNDFEVVETGTLKTLDEKDLEIQRLKEVVAVVKDIKWRSIDKDNMEFATSCYVVDRLRVAMSALEDT